MKDIRALNQAIKKADKHARIYDMERFVIHDGARFRHCDLYDLDTFYKSKTVLYSTDEN